MDVLIQSARSALHEPEQTVSYIHHDINDLPRTLKRKIESLMILSSSLESPAPDRIVTKYLVGGEGVRHRTTEQDLLEPTGISEQPHEHLPGDIPGEETTRASDSESMHKQPPTSGGPKLMQWVRDDHSPPSLRDGHREIIIEFGRKTDGGKRYPAMSIKEHNRSSLGPFRSNEATVEPPGSDALYPIGSRRGSIATPTYSYYHNPAFSTSSFTGSSQVPPLYITPEEYDPPVRQRVPTNPTTIIHSHPEQIKPWENDMTISSAQQYPNMQNWALDSMEPAFGSAQTTTPLLTPLGESSTKDEPTVNIGYIRATPNLDMYEFRCSTPGCGRSFGRWYDFRRHYDTVHMAKSEFWCAYPGCARSLAGGQPFLGKDKLNDHLRQAHSSRSSRSPGKEDFVDMGDSSRKEDRTSDQTIHFTTRQASALPLSSHNQQANYLKRSAPRRDYNEPPLMAKDVDQESR
jgi:hypothetical protein